ncbi:hypothetical protein IWZ01DRAFT_509396 [Phyllosticta capitalensis]
MATDDDEFGFADDLDSLPANTLRDIEAQAFLSTQLKASTQRPAADHDSDYGFDDEDVINLDDVNPRVPVAPPPAPTYQAQNEREPFYQHRLNRHAGISHATPAPAQTPRESGGIDDALLKLRREQAILERDRNAFRDQAQAKAGEASIIRSNYEKLVKEYNLKDSNREKAYAEERARYLAQVKDLERRLEHVNAANQFLENDIKQEAGKSRQKTRTLKDGSGNASKGPAGLATPRKNKTAYVGDGFDDGDMIMVSPSKPRSKQSTPKQGSKRKRTVGESPGKPLPLSENALTKSLDSPSIQEPESHDNILVEFEKDDDKFRFLKRLLNHRNPKFGSRFLETMATFALPSNQNQPLSSMIYDGLALHRSDLQDLQTHVCCILASIWEKCVQELYYSPIAPLIDVILFILAFEPLQKAVGLAETLVPLVINSTKASLDSESGPSHEETTISSCLSLLLFLTRNAAQTEETVATVWKLIPHDFPLLVLNLRRPRPLHDLDMMLRILATSNTSISFGPIAFVSTSETQAYASKLLDYLVILLTNRGTSAVQRSMSKEGLIRLRLSLLQTFSAMIASPAGSRSLALHPLFVGNLILLLNDSLDGLYVTTPGIPICETFVNIVNLATRVLYTLVTSENTKHLIDRRAKLAAVPGAGHKHLVGLTRLAFLELDENEPDASATSLPGDADEGPSVFSRWNLGSVLEFGIEPEVSDMAHAILDEFLSPEEGEILVRVFSSGKSAV